MEQADWSGSIAKTGVVGLDDVLGGGLPSRRCIVVTGIPGSGKTVLACQIGFNAARSGVPVLVATLTSEPHLKLIEDLRGFAFFDESLVSRSLVFLSAYAWLKKGSKELLELLLRSVQERRAKLLILDGIRAIRELWQEEARLREFLYDLGVGLNALNATGIYTAEYSLDELVHLPEATSVDGIISLGFERYGHVRYGRVEVAKLRGRQHALGLHAFQLNADGARVFPRFERRGREDADWQPPLTDGRWNRVSFGLPELDVLCDGGVPRGSSTLIAGSTGVGKTLLSCQFALHGAASGDQALIVTFDEPPGALIARAADAGLNLEPQMRAGRLALDYVASPEREADEIMAGLIARVEASGAKRVVIDSLADLITRLTDPTRTRRFLSQLVAAMRARDATLVLTREIPKLAGPEVDFADTPTSVAAENLVLLRHVELRGKLHRTMAIPKVRAGAHDWHIREFTISRSGLQVLEPIRSAEGLLTGVARHIGDPGGS